MDATNIIKSKIEEIERRENFKIIYACESGSRAWGFSSPDSDYDVRFIYVRNRIDYLRLNPFKDTFSFELNDVYDINGWDLKKMLALLLKSNPIIFEWAMSPIVYRTSDVWKEIYSILSSYVSPKALLYHYYSIAKGVLGTHFKDNQVVLKKYFYLIRPILAGRYVLDHEGLPPMAFEELAKDYLPLELKEDVDKLLVMKRNSGEKVIGPRIEKIDRWISNEMNYFYKKLVDTPKVAPKNDIELTELFAKIVG